MPNVVRETCYRSFERLGLLRDGQNDLSALVIIPLADNYSHDIEEGAKYEEIQEQRRSTGRKEIQIHE